MYGYAVCCALGAIFAKYDFCSNNDDESGKTRMGLMKWKAMLSFVVCVTAVGIIATAATIVATTVREPTEDTERIQTTEGANFLPTTLTTPSTSTHSSTTTSKYTTTTKITFDPTSMTTNCPDYLIHLSNVLYSESIGCILADIDDMTYSSFEEALGRCKY